MDMHTLAKTLTDLAPWHFAIDVAPGIRTTDYNKSDSRKEAEFGRVGTIDPEELRPLLENILPGGLKGRAFLDVGCNGGAYCLIAYELGASLCYGFDVREHWIRQAEFLRSLRFPSSPSIKFAVADLQKIDLDRKFDVTLFKGVLYHLADPLHMLMKLCGLTTRSIIVDTVSRNDIPANCIVPGNESVTGIMSGVDGLCWYPGSPDALRPLLAWCGFPHAVTIFHSIGQRDGNRRGRFRIVAAREESDLSALASLQR